jgi:hypothetical protein
MKTFVPGIRLKPRTQALVLRASKLFIGHVFEFTVMFVRCPLNVNVFIDCPTSKVADGAAAENDAEPAGGEGASQKSEASAPGKAGKGEAGKGKAKAMKAMKVGKSKAKAAGKVKAGKPKAKAKAKALARDVANDGKAAGKEKAGKAAAKPPAESKKRKTKGEVTTSEAKRQEQFQY